MLLLGLDNSGKATLLHRMNQMDGDGLGTPRPTLHRESCHHPESAWYARGGIQHAGIVGLLQFTEAVVFMVDSADIERLDEAREKLHWVLAHTNLVRYPKLAPALVRR